MRLDDAVRGGEEIAVAAAAAGAAVDGPAIGGVRAPPRGGRALVGFVGGDTGAWRFRGRGDERGVLVLIF